MKSNEKSKQTKSRRIWIPIMLVLLIAAGGFGYYTWNQNTAASTAVATATYKTTQVKRGSITISATGSGVLIANQESDLSFSSTGTVAKVEVSVGDLVKKGQVLAQLDNIDELQANIDSAEQDRITAEKELETLRNSAAENLAQAQLDVSTAEKAIKDAKSGLILKGQVRCDQDTINAYYSKYMKAQDALDALGAGGWDEAYFLTYVVPARNAVAQAKSAYDTCAGFTDYEISSSQATLALKEAELKQKQDTLAKLTKNSGLDPVDLATAENKVSKAQMALEQAKNTLQGATLTAPFDGTILSVAGDVGESVNTSTSFITIADLAHPQIEFSVDETDMDKVAKGETATVSFDAVPNRTFKGTVTRINPALSTSNGYQVVKGLIELDLSQEKDVPELPKSLNASVELIQATAKDVLIVPVDAVRDLEDGTYGVFVVGADGKPRLKIVEVGLMDVASAEIKSGLSLEDVVTTGSTQTK